MPGSRTPHAGPSPETKSSATRRAGWRWRMAQVLERRWWKRYLGNKSPGEYRTWKRRYWLDLLAPHRHALLLDEPQRLLDAGCGPAGINLALDGHNVTALDPLLDRYSVELPAFAALQVPGVAYISAPLEGYRHPQQVDGACCLNAINHVDDLDAALDALTAAVRPGGWLLLGVDAHRSPLLRALFRALPGDALHPHQHSAMEYRRFLEARGWQIEDQRCLKPGRIFDYVLFRARRQG
ncbi:MAG: methyltransferase domain-containing protein [Bacteroidetes bacterium]|nr:methyltransferase domain-containing protein [Bacteroidota bacterium]